MPQPLHRKTRLSRHDSRERVAAIFSRVDGLSYLATDITSRSQAISPKLWRQESLEWSGDREKGAAGSSLEARHLKHITWRVMFPPEHCTSLEKSSGILVLRAGALALTVKVKDKSFWNPAERVSESPRAET